MTIGGKRNILRIFTLKFTQEGKMHQTANRTAVYCLQLEDSNGNTYFLRFFREEHLSGWGIFV